MEITAISPSTEVVLRNSDYIALNQYGNTLIVANLSSGQIAGTIELRNIPPFGSNRKILSINNYLYQLYTTREVQSDMLVVVVVNLDTKEYSYKMFPIPDKGDRLLAIATPEPAIYVAIPYRNSDDRLVVRMIKLIQSR